VSGLARKRVLVNEPGLGEVKVSAGSELGPVPWPPAEPLCCEARKVSRPFGVLFGRYLTVSSELARTGGIRLSN
jgi:hypothetical protein